MVHSDVPFVEFLYLLVYFSIYPNLSVVLASGIIKATYSLEWLTGSKDEGSKLGQQGDVYIKSDVQMYPGY